MLVMLLRIFLDKSCRPRTTYDTTYALDFRFGERHSQYFSLYQKSSVYQVMYRRTFPPNNHLKKICKHRQKKVPRCKPGEHLQVSSPVAVNREVISLFHFANLGTHHPFVLIHFFIIIFYKIFHKKEPGLRVVWVRKCAGVRRHKRLTDFVFGGKKRQNGNQYKIFAKNRVIFQLTETRFL